MGQTRQQTGKLGERIAKIFLIRRGFSILAKNFSTPFGEIDLVAEQNGYIVFFEVKTRTSERFGPPVSAITRIKQKHILKNCQYYRKRYRLYNRPCRIDVIAISLDMYGKLQVLRHVKNAIAEGGTYAR